MPCPLGHYRLSLNQFPHSFTVQGWSCLGEKEDLVQDLFKTKTVFFGQKFAKMDEFPGHKSEF